VTFTVEPPYDFYPGLLSKIRAVRRTTGMIPNERQARIGTKIHHVLIAGMTYPFTRLPLCSRNRMRFAFPGPQPGVITHVTVRAAGRTVNNNHLTTIGAASDLIHQFSQESYPSPVTGTSHQDSIGGHQRTSGMK
jgi:hypothetical protein